MKTLKILTLLMLVTITGFGQTFVKDNTQNFVDLNGGDVIFADLNGDGKEDVVISGLESQSANHQVLVYMNDGSGNFTLKTTLLNDDCSLNFDIADIDGDGDQDIFITYATIGAYNDFHINDGNGNFTKVSANIVDFVGDIISFADTDGDGDQDLFMSGGDINGTMFAKLFRNDGSLNFVEVTNTGFGASYPYGLYSGDVEFFDIDKDGDLDFQYTGTSSGGSPQGLTMKNNGGNNFTQVNTSILTAMNDAKFDVADINGDGEMDLLTMGRGSNSDPSAGIVFGKTGFDYSTTPNNNVPQAYSGDVKFFDIDNDGDKDFVMFGVIKISNGNFPHFMKSFINDGTGNFTEFQAMTENSNGSLDYSDVDGDGDLDFIITGTQGTSLYLNEPLPCTLATTATSTNETMVNGNDGTASVSVTDAIGQSSFAWDNGMTSQSVSGLAPGTYNVTTTDANNCTSISSVTITEYVCNLSTNLSSTDESMLNGNDGTASVNNGGISSFVWSNGATTSDITGLAPGTYTVTITNNKGCVSNGSVSVSAFVCALSITTSSTDETNDGNNDGTATVNITSNNSGAHYDVVWNTNETTQTISNLTPDTYMVTVTSDKGCVEIASVTVSAGSSTTSINELSNVELSIYPNPATQTVNLIYNQAGYTITITNAIGQQVYATTSTTNQTTINLNAWEAGLYIITVCDHNANTIATKELVKE